MSIFTHLAAAEDNFIKKSLITDNTSRLRKKSEILTLAASGDEEFKRALNLDEKATRSLDDVTRLYVSAGKSLLIFSTSIAFCPLTNIISLSKLKNTTKRLSKGVMMLYKNA